MIFVLDTAIGFGVWLPFTFGKTTALLLVRAIEIHDSTRVHTILSARPSTCTVYLGSSNSSHEGNHRSYRGSCYRPPWAVRLSLAELDHASGFEYTPSGCRKEIDC